MNDNNTPREISEIPADEPEPVEERPATTEPLPVPTPSNESILSLEQIKAERASLSPPDNNIAVVLQSPPTALLTNEGMLLNICLTTRNDINLQHSTCHVELTPSVTSNLT